MQKIIHTSENEKEYYKNNNKYFVHKDYED